MILNNLEYDSGRPNKPSCPIWLRLQHRSGAGGAFGKLHDSANANAFGLCSTAAVRNCSLRLRTNVSEDRDISSSGSDQKSLCVVLAVRSRRSKDWPMTSPSHFWLRSANLNRHIINSTTA